MAACPRACEVPDDTLLARCRSADAFVDCYRVMSDRPTSLSQYIEAFYSSPMFKLERGLLGLVSAQRATDDDARALGRDATDRFAIWKVERRNEVEILLSTGRTRSWLMVGPAFAPGNDGVTLLFGSAVFPASNAAPGMGLPFHALLGLHKLYSRMLLASAVARLAAMRSRDSVAREVSR